MVQTTRDHGRRPWVYLDLWVHRLNRERHVTPHWVSRLACRLRGVHGGSYYTRA